MAKVVIGKLDRPTGGARKRKSASVSEKRILDAEGRRKTLRTADADSKTFGVDLRYIFEKNVAKARRDNKRLIGATDVAPAKA